MIEEGLVKLMIANAGISALAVTQGMHAPLPENATVPGWSYQFASNSGDYTLDGDRGIDYTRVQINCHGNNAAEAIRLAAAIDSLLSGYYGVLTDSDHTFLQGCFQTNLVDFFNDASRSYRRVVDYQLCF